MEDKKAVSEFINEDYARHARVWVVVASHKKYEMPNDKMYIPLHVGAAVQDKNKAMEMSDFQRDDTGENISERNPQFCELTGLYWAWKNLSADYIGLVHYRRHFKGRKKTEGNAGFERVLTYSELKPIIETHSVIVPKKRHYYIETLEQHYAHNHHEEELNTARDILFEKYPEYKNAYNTAMKRTWGYMFNMMILRKDLLDEYSEWLFDILFKLADELNVNEKNAAIMTPFEKRFPGRVSERLFNVWLQYQIETGNIKKKDIYEFPFEYMEHINIFKKGFTFIMAKFFNKKPKKSC